MTFRESVNHAVVTTEGTGGARKSVCGSQASVCAVTDALRRRYDGQADRGEGEEEGRVGVEKQVKKRGS